MKNLIKLFVMVCAVAIHAFIVPAQASTSRSSSKKNCCHEKRIITKKQYQQLLHQLYDMQSSLQKIKSSKKYNLLSLQVRHMLQTLKGKYPYNRLPVRKYRALCKKANKVQAEINHIAQVSL